MNPIQILMNQTASVPDADAFPDCFDEVERFHRLLPEYEPTPLLSLPSLARWLGIRQIAVKDESPRFGLNAFKGLGASFAIHRIRQKHPDARHFVTCTDGNHGKAVAWAAQKLGCEAVVLMPKGSEPRRIRAIEAYGAQVIVTDCNYDDSVRLAAQYAIEHQAWLVQDTALPGYVDIPRDIVMGYGTLVREALEQMRETPSHVFLQAGVGSFAGGAVGYLLHRLGDNLPFIGLLEAESVACFYESIRQHRTVLIGGEPHTAMAGLNCGEPNPAMLPLLKARVSCFAKCDDSVTFRGMFRARHPIGTDPTFRSGESGAVGLGFVEEILGNPDYREEKALLRLNTDSVVLLISTEGELPEETPNQ